jgi:hypothetical protein
MIVTRMNLIVPGVGARMRSRDHVTVPGQPSRDPKTMGHVNWMVTRTHSETIPGAGGGWRAYEVT